MHMATKRSLIEVNRREFLYSSVAGGAALLAGVGDVLLWPASANADGSLTTPNWFEATIPQPQTLMQLGQLTSRDLTLAYLSRIADLNPVLGAVIETNPDAVSIAMGLDDERHAGHVRGPLHGIPILVKDNI